MESEIDFPPNNFDIRGNHSQRKEQIQHDQNSFPFPQSQTSSNKNFINREDIHESAPLLHSLSRQTHQPILDIKDTNRLDQLNGLAERTPLSAVC